MTIARVYYMHAKEGMAPELEAGLRTLADMVTRMSGSRGVEMMRDSGNERRFLFIEKWDSIAAHKAGQAEFAKLDIRSVLAALDGPPDGSYFDCLAAS